MTYLFPSSLMRICFLSALFLAWPVAHAEEIILGTYNIEYFEKHFLAHRLSNQPVVRDGPGKELLDELRKKNDEDNWETAQVILDSRFNPDILVVQEGCAQADLEYFNRRWLSNTYATVIQFSSNTDRNQHLCLLMKPGLKILERRDQFYLEPDPVGNERGGRLFARGPVFVKVQSKSGYQFWVGLTHMKSKNVGSGGGSTSAGNGESADTRQRKIDATKWRNREAVRTRQIIKDLEKAGPTDIILLGDMNDSLGLDPYEPDGGGDAIANLIGPAEEGLVLATKPLTEQKQHSFNGYWRPNYRELIDHVIVTQSMKDQVLEVRIINDGLAVVSSDHFPVVTRIKTD